MACGAQRETGRPCSARAAVDMMAEGADGSRVVFAAQGTTPPPSRPTLTNSDPSRKTDIPDILTSMRKICLAGGTGSRLRARTLGVPTQLMPVYDRPTTYHPLSIFMAGQ